MRATPLPPQPRGLKSGPPRAQPRQSGPPCPGSAAAEGRQRWAPLGSPPTKAPSAGRVPPAGRDAWSDHTSGVRHPRPTGCENGHGLTLRRTSGSARRHPRGRPPELPRSRRRPPPSPADRPPAERPGRAEVPSPPAGPASRRVRGAAPPPRGRGAGKAAGRSHTDCEPRSPAPPPEAPRPRRVAAGVQCAGPGASPSARPASRPRQPRPRASCTNFPGRGRGERRGPGGPGLTCAQVVVDFQGHPQDVDQEEHDEEPHSPEISPRPNYAGLELLQKARARFSHFSALLSAAAALGVCRDDSPARRRRSRRRRRRRRGPGAPGARPPGRGGKSRGPRSRLPFLSPAYC